MKYGTLKYKMRFTNNTLQGVAFYDQWSSCTQADAFAILGVGKTGKVLGSTTTWRIESAVWTSYHVED